MKEPTVRGSIGPVHVASFLFIKKLQESRRLGKFRILPSAKPKF